MAGDVDLDGAVDGGDATQVDLGLPNADVTGDGTVDAQDRQVLRANFGFVQNAAPQLAATLPARLTHEDLPIVIDLAEVATDPDADLVFYRIAAVTNGAATLLGDGRSAMFTPASGFAGSASFAFIADDGFSELPVESVQINVSDQPLLALDFAVRRTLLEAGRTALRPDPRGFRRSERRHPAGLVCQCADARPGRRPGRARRDDYWRHRWPHRSDRGARLDRRGHRGRRRRGGYIRLLISQLFGIDAYPDAVTLVPAGGARQVVVSLA